MKYDITCTIILCAEPDINVQIYYIRLTKYFFYLNRFRTSEAQTTYTKNSSKNIHSHYAGTLYVFWDKWIRTLLFDWILSSFK